MKAFLSTLRKNDIHIAVLKGELSVKFPKGKINQEVVAEIKERKAELIAYLTVLNENTYSTIPLVAQQEGYTLSSSQKRLWVLSQFEDANLSYNMPGFYAFEGKLDVQALENAFDSLIARHEILRTNFREDEKGNVKQFVLTAGELDFKMVFEDLLGEKLQQEKVSKLFQTDLETAFDLAKAPLLRVRLLKLAENKYVLSCIMHHIISDGWSMEVILGELLTFYNTHVHGETNPLPALSIQYKDYAAWQQEQLQGNNLKNHKQYWLNQFSGELPVLELNGENVRPAIKTYNGQRIQRIFDKKISEGLKQLSQGRGATLFIGLLAGVKALLYRYTGQEDIIIGTVVAGRDHADLENQIGYYLNTLALRTRFNGEMDFNTLLAGTREITLAAYEHQVYPFDQLVDDLALKRDMSRSALFDVSVVLQNTDTITRNTQSHNSDEITVNTYEAAKSVTSKFDLSFTFEEFAGGLIASLDYNTDIYKPAFAERLLTHLESLLRFVTANPAVTLQQIDYLSAAEKNELLLTFNATVNAFPKQLTLVTKFEEQAAAFPDNIALVYKDTTISYKELNERANQLANYLLRRQNIKQGDLIGIKQERSESVLISILGVLKSGAAYLPVDPGYPQERIDYMLANSKCTVVLDEEELELFNTERSRYSKKNLDTLSAPTDLAYVIYTSGSTGKPKGVMIEHRAVLNTILSQIAQFAINSSDKGLQFASFSFDASVWETFLILLSGAGLYVIDEEQRQSPELFASYLKNNGITIATIPPTYLNQLDVATIPVLKALITAGESPVYDKLAAYAERGTCYNAYGPTETSICGTVFKFDKEAVGATRKVPIGKPIANAQVYILDKNNTLVPIGITGEIAIGGNGLARGYLYNESLTAEKFMAHPFEPGARIYKTGDLGKWLPNGNIEFVGRKDEQVKIRGHRIELGEVEAALQSHEKIAEAIVLVKADSEAQNTMTAYMVSSENLTTQELTAYLNNILPEYMVPAHFVQLPMLPLTSNGKVDKKALLNSENKGMASGAVYIAPATETEIKIVKIWEAVLAKERIGMADDFFTLGGDSIKILRISSELKKKLDINIPIALFYKRTTIESLLEYVHENSVEINQQIAKNKKDLTLVEEELSDLKARILSSSNISDQQNIADIYPMSDIEKGMVYASLLNSQIYHDQVVHQKQLDGFSLPLFTKALELLVSKHAILRTAFNVSDFETGVQVVYKKIDVNVFYKTIPVATTESLPAVVENYLAAERSKPFVFSSAPLWRISVLDLGAHNYAFVFQWHHSIIDGWSEASFIAELYNTYFKLHEDAKYTPAQLKSTYKDVIIQQELIKRDKTVSGFWKNELSGYERLDLFTEEDEEQHYSFMLDKQELLQLQNATVASGVTFKVLSFSAYLYTLKIIGATNEVVAGLVSNNRPDSEDGDKILGCFLNTIPFKFKIDEALSGKEFVDQVSDKLTALKAYDRLSLFEIAQLHKGQSALGNPFFDTFFNYVDFHAYDEIKNEASAEKEKPGAYSIIGGHALTNTYMDLTIDRTAGDYLIHLRITKKLKYEIAAERIGKLYIAVLKSLLSDSKQSLNKLSYLSAVEQQTLLFDFNNTAATYPVEKTLVNLFEAQVKDRPDAIALTFKEQHITYRELNERSNQLASYLKKTYKIKPDELVGILQERSPEMIISILAALKSGGAYVPIDPTYPQERIAYLVSDSNCKVVLDAAELEKFKSLAHSYSIRNTKAISGPGNLAYVIYTSGSTGKPKGCMLEHRGVINRLQWMWEKYNFTTSEVILQKTTFTFDVSVWELFLPLCWGAKMVLCEKDDIASPERILKLIAQQQVTCLHFVPSMLSTFIAAIFDRSGNLALLGSLKRVITSGEALSVETVRQWYSKTSTVIHNLYGPTEASVDVSYYATSPADKKIPIGKPIWNTQLYILSSDYQLSPIGVAGEICIGGDGLARGYLNKAALSAEKFVNNPFKANDRIYKTGDIGRWLPDGNIEYLGRKDDQVKIRGYRIELGEIEAALQSHDQVTAAAVLAKLDANEEKHLAAYVVSTDELNTTALRQYLKQRLPEYMVPEHFVQLKALPLTPNGKLNRKALPDVQGLGMATGVEYVAPRNELEQKLVNIWSEILALPKETIGIKDHFFELGGHSLKATRLSSHIHKLFEVKLELKELFANMVLENQAALIANAQKTNYDSIKPVGAQSSYPLSSSQRRLWVLSQFKEANLAYNMPGFYIFEGVLDVVLLELAFKTLIVRHEILRTVFKENEEREIRQFILDEQELDFKIGYEDVQHEQQQAEKVERLVQAELETAFDLTQGPLLRVKLIQLRANKYIFSYVMHHIISDGWSMEILLSELLTLYNAYSYGKDNPLPPLRIQYKDYASWQQEQLSGDNLIGHKAYWLKQFAGELPVLELSGDHIRPAVKTYNGKQIQKVFNKELSAGIKAISQQRGATLFMGLLAGLNALLHRYTSQEDIIIGTPIAGRSHADLEDQIGIYLNTLALRTRFKGESSFTELLNNVRDHTLEAYEHQVYPFDELVDELALKRDTSRSALFDVMLVLQNTTTGSVNKDAQNLGALSISDYNGGISVISKFDLSFNFTELDEKLFINLEFNSDIFNKATALRLLDHLELLFSSAIADPAAPLNKLSYLSAVEQQTLLFDFNNTAATYPVEKTLVNLFEAQVKQRPDAIALTFKEQHITYRELNERSNQLASYLKKAYKIKPDELVAILQERSPEMIISILAALKSGGAYVPIDPTYPQERIDYLVSDSNCKVVLDAAELEKFKSLAYSYSIRNTKAISGPGNLAYVIYTSGSTGKPKGCMLEHRGVINRLQWMWEKYNFTTSEVILQKTTFTFDVSVWELFLPLCWGAKMVLCEKDDIASPERILKLIAQQQVTCLHFVPSMLSTFIAATFDRSGNLALLGSLKRVITSGEALSVETVRQWYSKTSTVIHNLYGPTEASVDVSYYATSPADKKIPIGKPIWNTQLYILSSDYQLSPIGVAGEICIGGDGLARGYLNKAALSAEKFVNNPFKANDRIYKTGDIGRWLPDGNIEYLGRKDDQVKIRGYRIELGEIEAALQSHDQVTAAAVLAKLDANGEKHLAAYVVSTDELNTTALRQYLKQRLPEYMVPEHFVQLKALPLTPNGKLNRKALPDVQGLGMATGVEYVAPKNELEQKLVAVWETILNKKQIGVNDNFFDSGGNSIKIIQLSKLISNELNKDISIPLLFQYPSIRDLVAYLKQEHVQEEEMIDRDELISELNKFNYDE